MTVCHHQERHSTFNQFNARICLCTKESPIQTYILLYFIGTVNTIRQHALDTIISLKDADTSTLHRHPHDKLYCLPWVMVVVVVASANEAMGDSAVVEGLVPVVVVDTVVLEVEISLMTVVSGAEKITIQYKNCKRGNFAPLWDIKCDFKNYVVHQYFKYK